MSRSSSSPDRLTARVSGVASALSALIAGLGAQARWRLGGRPEPIFNNGNRGDGPPDMEEMWRDFNRRLSGLFGGKGGGGQRPGTPGPGGGNYQPDMRNAGVGIGLIAGVVVLIWLGSGFFIVQEGQQAVVTSFGKYDHTASAGFSWRFPYPFQAHETVAVTQLRTVDVGRNSVAQSTGLRESSMLTQDENIVDIRFTVQYTVKDARAFLYENRDPEAAVVQAAESAVREIVGRSVMDSVLYEQRDALAADLQKLLQTQLDRLNTGILVVNVNVGSVQPPEQVQAAFDDAARAVADSGRFKNDGEAYANDVIPKAKGSAARLREQAEGYRSRVVAEAEGDAERFTQVLTEYQKAPGVTRDRLYIDAMRTVYSNVTKVMVDARSNSNLLYLPLDKIIAQTTGAAAPAAAAPASPAPETLPSALGTNNDSRSRDGARSRDRETR
ncbi:MAG: FtsH protease activity modulator HflK [Rhizobacter sp.]